MANNTHKIRHHEKVCQQFYGTPFFESKNIRKFYL